MYPNLYLVCEIKNSFASVYGFALDFSKPIFIFNKPFIELIELIVISCDYGKYKET